MNADNAQADSNQYFRVVDYGESRHDLVSRMEVKYLLPNADTSKLRTVLLGRCRQQIHNERVSVVHSLYFDDARLSACYANLNGDGRRQKVRLRWYDAIEAPDKFFFEIKWRNSRVTGKHRLQIQSDQPLHRLTYKQIAKRLFDVTPAEHLPSLVNFADPVVLVQYKREHFVSSDSELRLTLDYDITFCDQLGKQTISTAFAKRLEGFVIVEGKTPVGREAELRKLLWPVTPRTERCSKYVHGCRELGHIHRGQ